MLRVLEDGVEPELELLGSWELESGRSWHNLRVQGSEF